MEWDLTADPVTAALIVPFNGELDPQLAALFHLRTDDGPPTCPTCGSQTGWLLLRKTTHMTLVCHDGHLLTHAPDGQQPDTPSMLTTARSDLATRVWRPTPAEITLAQRLVAALPIVPHLTGSAAVREHAPKLPIYACELAQVCEEAGQDLFGRSSGASSTLIWLLVDLADQLTPYTLPHSDTAERPLLELMRDLVDAQILNDLLEHVARGDTPHAPTDTPTGADGEESAPH